MILRFIWKFKVSRSRCAKEEQSWRTLSPEFKSCYNTTVIKTVWDCPKDGQIEINGTKYTAHKEIFTFNLSWYFRKAEKQFNRERNIFLTNALK